MRPIETIALIPAYNESARIQPVVKQTLGILHVLVIDDGSSDDTAAAARAAGAEVLMQTPNQGKGVALQAGFQYALKEGYQVAVTLDADGQHDPRDIPKFLQAYRERNADLIIGKRQFRHMPPIRRLANTLGEKTFSWAIGQAVPDNQSGFRLLSRRMMEANSSGVESGFEFELEMIVTCVNLGYTLDSVPIRTIYAGESSHIDPIHHLTNFLRLTWQTRQRTRKAR